MNKSNAFVWDKIISGKITCLNNYNWESVFHFHFILYLCGCKLYKYSDENIQVSRFST